MRDHLTTLVTPLGMRVHFLDAGRERHPFHCAFFALPPIRLYKHLVQCSAGSILFRAFPYLAQEIAGHPGNGRK